MTFKPSQIISFKLAVCGFNTRAMTATDLPVGRFACSKVYLANPDAVVIAPVALALTAREYARIVQNFELQ